MKLKLNDDILIFSINSENKNGAKLKFNVYANFVFLHWATFSNSTFWEHLLKYFKIIVNFFPVKLHLTISNVHIISAGEVVCKTLDKLEMLQVSIEACLIMEQNNCRYTHILKPLVCDAFFTDCGF